MKAKNKLKSILDQQSQAFQAMQETKCWSCPQASFHLTQVDTASWRKEELAEIEKVLSGGVGEKERDFDRSNAILTRYKIIDADLNLLFKGKVATHTSSTDVILMTEFFFSGLIQDLTDSELLAIFSLFDTHNKAAK